MSGELGKIVTFYSYKGGTGRSMALANVAWILASNGLRVLVIDWDLEAPGLHRYFHPFLIDKELTSSPGLIDYFVDVNAAAHAAAAASSTTESPWWTSWTSLLSYTYSIDWPFPNDGTIDLVPAGRQGPGYAERVGSYNWTEFYDAVGGGVLLEALKRELRKDYDYVLIDSRTGISDTSGICTVQMPDDLVVCFTLNQQSIKGAAAAADSAWTQRLKPSGEPGLRVWPVPTRIELAESERREAMGEVARQAFQRYLMHMRREDRDRYWAEVQVLYQAIFAYEEILAPFVERHRRTGSMLGSMEVLTGALTDRRITALGKMSPRERQDGFDKFVTANPLQRTRSAPASTVYLSFPERMRDEAARIHEALSAAHISVFSGLSLLPGDNWVKKMETEAMNAAAVIVLCDRGLGNLQAQEVERALAAHKRVIPALIGSGDFSTLPPMLSDYQAVDLRGFSYDLGILTLVTGLRKILALDSESTFADAEDPEKGRWGRSPSANGRILTAMVEEVASGWFSIRLEVSATNGRPVTGEVVFHLHPSFRNAERRVVAKQGRASLKLNAWGAFTVGAEVDEGRTTLELDLSEIEAPELFLSR